MAGEIRAGGAWYELAAEDDKLRADLARAEAALQQAGVKGEREFAQPIERGADRAGDAISAMARSVSGLEGRSADELASALDRTQREADEALTALRDLSRADLPEDDARRYADAVAEIEAEAQVTASELRELQRAQPEFDTPELRQAATELDRLGDEANTAGNELREIARSNADTTLAKAARESRSLAGGLDDAGKRSDSLFTKLRSVQGLLVGLGLAIGTQQIVGFLKDTVQAASDLNETVSKSSQIFGQEATPQLERWAETAADTFGQSKQQALDAAATFGIFGKSAGLAGQELVGFSTEMTELASDLASFHNTSPEEAITAIGAALRGESEPIRRFGVLLDDATLRARAFELGLISTTKNALTPQQKVLAAQAAIFEQTADAQGDFARTSDELANTQRSLEAQWEDMQATLGEKLLPVMLGFATFVKDDVIPVLTEMVGLLDGNSESLEGFARILDQVTFNQGKVQDVMRLTGLSYMDAREAIKAWNEETGQSGDVLIDLIEKHGSLEAALRSQTTTMTEAWAEAWQGMAVTTENGMLVVADEVRGGGPAVGDAADAAIAEEVAQAAAAAREAAVDEIASMVGDLVGLFTRDDFKAAVEEFHAIINNPWPDTRRRARIEAVLASKEVRDGLRSEDSSVRAKTIEFVNGLLAEYETLAPGALAAGELVNPELQKGLERNLAQTLKVAEGIAIATGNELQFAEWAEAAGYDGLLSYKTGLDRGQRGAVASVQQTANLIRSEADVDLYQAGLDSGTSLARGLTAAQREVVSSAQFLAQMMRNQFAGSEPRDPSSPLRGITDAWGFSDVLAAGIRQRSDLVRDAIGDALDVGPLAVTARVNPDVMASSTLAALAGARVPATTVQAALSPTVTGPGAFGSPPIVQEVHHHHEMSLHVEGFIPEPTTEDDIRRLLRRMELFPARG